MGKELGYHGLDVYKKANELVLLTYKITRSFPKNEMFGLVTQMRRAAISIVANIIEGYTMDTNRNKLRFCNMSKGSLTELEYYIDLVLQLNYIHGSQHQELTNLRIEVGKLLGGFIKSIK